MQIKGRVRRGGIKGWAKTVLSGALLGGLAGAPVLTADTVFDPVRPGTGSWTVVDGGGFESVSGALPVFTTYVTPGNWYLFTSASSSATATATAEASAARVGGTGIRVRPGSFNGPGVALTLGKVMNLPAGVPHVLSGWVRRSATPSAGAKVYLDLWGAVGGFRVDTVAQPGWQFVHGVFTPGGAAVGIRAVVDGAVPQGEEFSVDELAITPLSQFVAPEESIGLINVRFGTKDSPPIFGPAAVGRLPQDAWNHYSRDAAEGGFKTVGSVVPLLDSRGLATSAGLVIENAAGAWGTGLPHPLMQVYLYPLGGSPSIDVTLTNLPTGVYDVLAYGHGGPPDDFNTSFSLSSGEAGYGSRSTTTNASWRGAEWVEGAQYVRFRDVFVSASAPLRLRADKGAQHHPSLNGLQLVRWSAERFHVSPNSRDFTNSIEVRAVSEPAVKLRFSASADPTSNSPVLPASLTLTEPVSLRIQAFEGTTPVSPVFVREYRRVYVLDTVIPREWHVQYFGTGYAYNPLAVPGADADADGSTNLEEYRNGTHPLDPLKGFAAGARLVPAVTWVSVPNVTYRILRKDRLSDPQWIEIARVKASGDRSEYADTTVQDVPRFYRVEAMP